MPLYRQFTEAFNRHRVSDLEIWITLIGLLALGLALIARSMWKQREIKNRRKGDTLRRFIVQCEEIGLFPDEIAFIKAKAKKINFELNSGLMGSNAVFDRFAVSVINSADKKHLQECNTELHSIRNKFGFKPPPRGFPLSSTRELTAGQAIFMILPTDVFLEARVTEVDELSLNLKLQAGYPRASLTPGMQVYLHFNRIADARYSGPSEIIKTNSDERGIFVTLQHCSSLHRDQRRQDFRIDEDRSVSIWVLDEETKDLDDPIRAISKRIPVRAILEDISGGGASIIFERSLPANESIVVNLDPSGNYGLPLIRGTVLRSNRRGRTDKWALSVRFEDLKPSEHQKIVNHVFLKERDLLNIA